MKIEAELGDDVVSQVGVVDAVDATDRLLSVPAMRTRRGDRQPRASGLSDPPESLTPADSSPLEVPADTVCRSD
jgi:hypothetical protein